MNWKVFKNKIEKQGLSETDFILGIDLGDATSMLSFFDINRRAPEIIDISGGYGKQSVPTVAQYIPDTKEWIFGEYAVLNKGFGNEISVNSLVGKLGIREYVDIDKKPVSYTNILTFYVKELLGSCYSINPKAEIGGIVIAVPEYLSEEAKEELMLVFNTSGYGKAVIELASDKECILHHHYYGKKVKNEKILLIDFGSREIRGSIYDIKASYNDVTAKSLSYSFSSELSTSAIDADVESLFTEYYMQETGTKQRNLNRQTKELLSAFTYQHKDLLFQKRIDDRFLKLYFNFAYPAFQKNITKEIVDTVLAPYRSRLKAFLQDLFSKAPKQGGRPLSKEDISAVICTGGGFEMLWVREELQKIFRGQDLYISKNPKGIISQGACIMAASKLSAVKTDRFYIEDNNKINVDIGIRVKVQNTQRFIPVIEKNSFWWQRIEDKTVILNEATDKTVFIDIYKRDRDGEEILLDKLKLDGLPKRPKGTTRLGISLEFYDYNKLTATVRDYGFGELFKASDYEEKFEVNTVELGRV